MKHRILLSLFLVTVIFSCSTEDGDRKCKAAIFDTALYERTGTQHYTIKSAAIVDQCLEVEIQSSGCSGKTWKLDLIDSEIIKQGEIPQRFLKLSLQSDELCAAVITKTESFDLRAMRTTNKKLVLNLVTWDAPLVVEF